MLGVSFVVNTKHLMTGPEGNSYNNFVSRELYLSVSQDKVGGNVEIQGKQKPFTQCSTGGIFAYNVV